MNAFRTEKNRKFTKSVMDMSILIFMTELLYNLYYKKYKYVRG